MKITWSRQRMLVAMSNPLFELLYISFADGGLTTENVQSLAFQASASNAKTGITGMLVFDGERFCQHLEGEEITVRRMYETLLRDDRHYDVRVLHSGPSTQRKFRRFTMGFATLGDVELLRELVELEGERAMRAFAGIVPLIDM
jgi:hypothetical protein